MSPGAGVRAYSVEEAEGGALEGRTPPSAICRTLDRRFNALSSASHLRFGHEAVSFIFRSGRRPKRPCVFSIMRRWRYPSPGALTSSLRVIEVDKLVGAVGVEGASRVTAIQRAAGSASMIRLGAAGVAPANMISSSISASLRSGSL